ncbi:hypothetical protein [Lentilitoribacter sp. EG35]|uniref:hypothetical protein n=1 Tax=Lentilitoribacter sp. EG35 TaxID=3234192 RepID=UPI00345FA1B3
MKDVIPCTPNSDAKKKIAQYSEELKIEAHKIGTHGLSKEEFYESGIFEGSIERLRGQKSASLAQKKQFVSLVLNHMQDDGYIIDWEEAGAANRHDLSITLNSNRVAVIELKGCLDGNNTNISDRPAHAEEFVTWSLCQNKTSNLQKGVWSGIHTRMGADIVDTGKGHDGLIVWDWICNTIARPCPKVIADPSRTTTIGQYILPPPCLYSFPKTAPQPRNNPNPPTRDVLSIEIMKAFYDCFGGEVSELSTIEIEVKNEGADLVRKTTVKSDGKVCRSSKFTALKRR